MLYDYKFHFRVEFLFFKSYMGIHSDFFDICDCVTQNIMCSSICCDTYTKVYFFYRTGTNLNVTWITDSK